MKVKLIVFPKKCPPNEILADMPTSTSVDLNCPKQNCKFVATSQSGMTKHINCHKDCPYCDFSFGGHHAGQGHIVISTGFSCIYLETVICNS